MTRLVINRPAAEVWSHVAMGGPISSRQSRDATNVLLADITSGLRDALQAADWKGLQHQGGRLGRLLGSTLVLLEAGLSGDPKRTPDLTLELGEEAASQPWELATVRGAPLLEGYGCGRHVVLTERGGEQRNVPPREVLTPPVRVLLVLDTSLEWACREIDTLDKRLQADDRFACPSILRNSDPETLVRNLADKDIVHFAGHSDASDTNPRSNGWKLEGGVFNPAYVQTANLERWPALVFANTCPTTDAAHMVADPLAVSMLLNGVGHYISTFSPITDSRLSASFAFQVYEGLLQGKAIGAAMSTARYRLSWDTGTEPPTRNESGSIAAAHYVLYGNPAERVFETVIAAAPVRRAAALIGRYEVIEAAGRDPSRAFYRAKSPDGVEVLVATLQGNPAAASSALRDGLSRLENSLRDCPRLLPLLDIGGENGTVYFAQPARGPTLDFSAPWAENEARRVFEELAAAVHDAHRRDLRHGELRPEAFEQDPATGGWRLRDTGWAEYRERHGLKGGTDSAAYRSPEQWASPVTRIDVAGDLWALAVIGFQLLAGRHPFGEARDFPGGWQQAVTEGEVLVTDLPTDLAVFFRRALARDGARRFRTAEELLAAFRRRTVSRGGFEPDIEQALTTGAGVFFINTADEADTIARLRAIAAARSMEFRTWSLTSGITAETCGAAGAPGEHTLSPYGALQWLAEQQKPTMLAALDFDAYLDDWQVAMHPEQPFREFQQAAAGDPSSDFHSYVSLYEERGDEPGSARALPKAEVRRLLADFARRRAADGELGPHKLIIVAPGFVIPEDLNKHIQVFQARPAGRDDVYAILRDEGAAREPWAERFAWCAAGLTITAVRGVIRLARVRHGELTEAVIGELIREKSQMVRRRGLLEFIPPDVTLAKDVVGVHRFRLWVALHRFAMTNPAAAVVLPGGQGVVLGGLAGTGKSLCARAIAGELDWPLLRLDIGRIFTGLLGGAEENLREALAMAEAMGPVVLLVDDLDRALGHGQGGGVSGRVMNTLLTWMQERDRGVFLAATISDPTALPIEVLRAGRFEHMFFFDLPGEAERAELVAHCLRRHGRNPDPHTPEELAAATDWLSHADIAGRVEESLFVAAAAGRLDPSPQELLEALRLPVVSEEKKKEIERLRRLWQGVERASE